MRAIERAVQVVGGQAALAREITARAAKITPQAVHQWATGERPVPAHHCLAIETATAGAVTRYELRPDVFGPAPAEQQQGAA